MPIEWHDAMRKAKLPRNPRYDALARGESLPPRFKPGTRIEALSRVPSTRHSQPEVK